MVRTVPSTRSGFLFTRPRFAGRPR